MDIQFPRNFVSFADGSYVSDEEVNEWIQECIRDLKNETEGYAGRSSGNTRVTVHKYLDEDEIHVYVSRGYYHGIVDRNGKPVFDNEEANV